MYGDQEQLGAVEVHALDAALSLAQVRQLFSRVAPVLQTVAALDSDSQNGVALVIYASDNAAASAVDLFDGCPLGNTFLRVKRADSLPNSLINLLYSLDQQSNNDSAAAAAAAAHQQQAAAASSAAVAAFLEQQQRLMQQQEQQRRQQHAWDVASQEQQRQAQQHKDAAAAAGSWTSYTQEQMGNGPTTNGRLQNGPAGALAAQQKQQKQLKQLEADLIALQLEQHKQQLQLDVEQAAAATRLRSPQQNCSASMTWANAANAMPSLTGRLQHGGGSQTVAAALAAAASGGFSTQDKWQTAISGRGRHGRRSAHTTASSGTGESSGRATSSGSSGSPRPSALSAGRRSEDKATRPGGQDGASTDPTTKLWMGGIDGSASAETVRAVFGRFGPIYDYELQPATHEKGRTDQWGFVNYKKIGDAHRAYEALGGEIIPELTGTRKLKLQFRPVDSRRPSGGRR